MIQTYRRWVELFVYAAVRGEAERRLVQAQALITDVLVQTMTACAYASSIASGSVPADALTLIGSERQLPRYAAETDFSYALRLQAAWTAWQSAGTAPAIVSQFEALGMASYVRDVRRWAWDANTAWWSRLWLVITQHSYSEWTLSNAITLGDDNFVIGLSAKPPELALMRAVVRKWKPAHVKASHLIFVMDATQWAEEQPDGTWDDDTRRSTSAAYIEA